MYKQALEVMYLQVRVQGDYKQLSQEYEKNMFESKTVQCLGHGKADGRTISKAKAHNATSRAAKTQIDSSDESKLCSPTDPVQNMK